MRSHRFIFTGSAAKTERKVVPLQIFISVQSGRVEKIDDHTSRFYAEVYDASELVPWIRTFICRITEIHFSNKILEDQFVRDIQKMYELYDLEGGEEQ